MDNVKTVIEALIFASEVPLTVGRIREILPDVEINEINRLLHELADEYRERKGGFYLHEVAGGFHFRTRTELGPWIIRLKKTRPVVLSRAAMETLAIIAYRQPVIKSEIDSIRGVDTGGALKGLLDKKLVRMMGRKDVPGRPIVYGTTKRFLEVFNLKELTELPTLRELKDLKEEPQTQSSES